MPKRTDIKSILILGAGPIVIGQACEFDYSGAQACKALREEGYRVILVNSNPATIMTDPELADATYIEPITPEMVAKIIEKERPDALLPTMGGQTGLNTSLALEEMGVLEKFGVEMIGANADAIDKGAKVITSRGEAYTEQNIKQKLLANQANEISSQFQEVIGVIEKELSRQEEEENEQYSPQEVSSKIIKSLLFTCNKLYNDFLFIKNVVEIE